MKSQMMKCQRSVWATLFLATISMTQWGWGVRTNDVELGEPGGYDNQIHIRRIETGELVFQDSVVSSVTLQQLHARTASHGALTGLNNDDHPIYLTAPRHQNAHTANFNSSLTIPVDVGGNGSLGAHTRDSNIHLPRNQPVEITGDWRFSGTPKIWHGLDLSAAGGDGDVLINFQNGATTGALLQWQQSAGRFHLNRPLHVESDLCVTSGALISGDLKVGGVLRGVWADTSIPSEFLEYRMDDCAASTTVADATGRRNGILIHAGGNASTDAHTTAGIVGAALAFDGVNDYISLGTNLCNDILTTGHDFSIAWWWKSPMNDFPTTGEARMFTFDNKLRAYNLFSGGVNITNLCMERPGSSATLSYSQTGENDNVWRHYVLQRQGDTDNIFRDGVLRYTNTNSLNSRAYDITGFYEIGGSATGNRARGAMDQFRVYGQAISEAEILALYKGGGGTASMAKPISEIDGSISAARFVVGPTTATGNVRVLADVNITSGINIGSATGAATGSLNMSGVLGMGTNTPLKSRIHLAGSDTSGFAATVRLQDQNTSGADCFVAASDAYWPAGANKMLFGIGGEPASSRVNMAIDGPTGCVGIGTTTPGTTLQVKGTFYLGNAAGTDSMSVQYNSHNWGNVTSGTRYGMRDATQIYPTSNTSANFYGFYSNPRFRWYSGCTQSGEMVGFLGSPQPFLDSATDNQTVTVTGNIIGVKGFPGASTSTGDTINVSSMMSLYGANPFKGTGTITNVYGCYIEPLNAGSNNWGIYVAGNNPSRFGGTLDVCEATSMGAALNLNGHVINNLAEPVNDQDAATKSFSRNAGNLTTGTVPDTRLSANIPRLNAPSNTFMGALNVGLDDATDDIFNLGGCSLAWWEVGGRLTASSSIDVSNNYLIGKFWSTNGGPGIAKTVEFYAATTPGGSPTTKFTLTFTDGILTAATP